MNLGHGWVITSLKTQCMVIHPCPKIVWINLESLRDVIVPWDVGYASSLEGPVHTCTYTVHRLAPLRWRHNRRDGVSNNLSDCCLLNRLFRRRSKKTSKLRVTGLCARTSPVTGEFPAQRASNEENVSIWWRHHVSTVPTDVLAL